MVDGDVDSAEAVTHTRIAETQNDGSTIIKHIVESLDSTPLASSAGPCQMETSTSYDDFNNEQFHDMSPPRTPRPRKSKVNFILIL